MALFDEKTGGFVSYLKGVTTVWSLLQQRIYPDAAKQGAALPYAVYTRNGGAVFNHLAGQSRIRITVLHVYAWGETRKDANEAAESIYTALCVPSFRGTMGTTTIHWIRCLDTPDDGFDIPMDGSDTKKYWTRYIYRIGHSEN